MFIESRRIYWETLKNWNEATMKSFDKYSGLALLYRQRKRRVAQIFFTKETSEPVLAGEEVN